MLKFQILRVGSLSCQSLARNFKGLQSIGACLVIDIASVSSAQEHLVRKLRYKYLLVALPLASYTEVLIARHAIFQTGKTS